MRRRPRQGRTAAAPGAGRARIRRGRRPYPRPGPPPTSPARLPPAWSHARASPQHHGAGEPRARIDRDLVQVGASPAQRFDAAVGSVAVHATDDHREAVRIDGGECAYGRAARAAGRFEDATLRLDRQPAVRLVVAREDGEQTRVTPASLARKPTPPRRHPRPPPVQPLVPPLPPPPPAP